MHDPFGGEDIRRDFHCKDDKRQRRVRAEHEANNPERICQLKSKPDNARCGALESLTDQNTMQMNQVLKDAHKCSRPQTRRAVEVLFDPITSDNVSLVCDADGDGEGLVGRCPWRELRIDPACQADVEPSCELRRRERQA